MFRYFRPKSLGFFFIRQLVCFRVITSQLLIEFSFAVLGCPVLSVFLGIFLIFLLSSVLSGLFPQFVLLFFLVLRFPFCLFMFQRVSFVLLF